MEPAHVHHLGEGSRLKDGRGLPGECGRLETMSVFEWRKVVLMLTLSVLEQGQHRAAVILAVLTQAMRVLSTLYIFFE